MNCNKTVADILSKIFWKEMLLFNLNNLPELTYIYTYNYIYIYIYIYTHIYIYIYVLYKILHKDGKSIDIIC